MTLLQTLPTMEGYDWPSAVGYRQIHNCMNSQVTNRQAGTRCESVNWKFDKWTNYTFAQLHIGSMINCQIAKFTNQRITHAPLYNIQHLYITNLLD